VVSQVGTSRIREMPDWLTTLDGMAERRKYSSSIRKEGVLFKPARRQKSCDKYFGYLIYSIKKLC